MHKSAVFKGNDFFEIWFQIRLTFDITLHNRSKEGPLLWLKIILRLSRNKRLIDSLGLSVYLMQPFHTLEKLINSAEILNYIPFDYKYNENPNRVSFIGSIKI